MTKEEALMTIKAIPESFWEKLSDAENEAVEMAVKTLKQQMWIPCSERLPKEPDVNPTFEGKRLELYLVSVNNIDYPLRAFWTGKVFTDGWSKIKATAWMPLPEPYKGD